MKTTDEAAEYGQQILTGELVRLREVRDEDIDQLAAWWGDTGLAPLGTFIVKPRPPKKSREQIEQYSANDPDSPSAMFAAVRRDTDELVGSISLFRGSAQSRSTLLGVGMSAANVGKGYGTDSVRVMVGYGFRELNYNRIELRVFAYNTRAIASYKKVGFVEEGRLRQAVFHDGRYHDEVVMSILAADYFV